MSSCLYVAVGGAVGSVLRYLVGLIRVSEATAFPVKTLMINIVGSFLIGLIAALAGNRPELDPNTVLLLKVGVCGGFTTFSTFALETADLLQNGKAAIAVSYIVLSVLLSVAAVFMAQSVIK